MNISGNFYTMTQMEYGWEDEGMDRYLFNGWINGCVEVGINGWRSG